MSNWPRTRSLAPPNRARPEWRPGERTDGYGDGCALRLVWLIGSSRGFVWSKYSDNRGFDRCDSLAILRLRERDGDGGGVLGARRRGVCRDKGGDDQGRGDSRLCV